MLGGVHAAQPRASEDEAAIRDVLDRYVVNWREGNGEGLSKVFELDNGYVIWTSGEGDAESVGSMSFADIVARDKGPVERYGHTMKILTIDVVDEQLATAHFEVGFAKGSYTNVFTLYKVGAEWKVVTKTFVTRLDESS